MHGKQVLFSARETEAAAAAYLRNHDAALKAAPPLHPLILVLDDLRSGANVGNILRLAEAAALEEVTLAVHSLDDQDCLEIT